MVYPLALTKVVCKLENAVKQMGRMDYPLVNMV